MNKNGVVIRVCALEVPNIVEIEQINNTWFLTDNGIISKTFLIILKHLGWRYDLGVLSIMEHGINTTWKECCDMLKKNETDVILPVETTGVDDYAFNRIPVLFDNVPFFIRAPGLVSEFSAIIKPFSAEVWIIIEITLIVGTFAFYGILISSSVHSTKNVKKRDISTIFWDLLYSLHGKGICSFNYVIGSSAIFAIIWSLAILVLTNAYSGALMSYITFPGLMYVPRSYSDLIPDLQAKLLDASLPWASPLLERLQHSKHGIPKKLGRLLKTGIIVGLPPLDGVEKLKKGNHALITYGILGKTSMASANGVDVVESEESLFISIAGLLMREKSPFFKLLYSKMQRCIEAGIVGKITGEKTRGWKKNGVKARDTCWKPLTLEQLEGPFLVLIFGHVFAIACLIAEIIIFKINKSRRNKNENL